MKKIIMMKWTNCQSKDIIRKLRRSTLFVLIQFFYRNDFIALKFYSKVKNDIKVISIFFNNCLHKQSKPNSSTPKYLFSSLYYSTTIRCISSVLVECVIKLNSLRKFSLFFHRYLSHQIELILLHRLLPLGYIDIIGPLHDKIMQERVRYSTFRMSIGSYQGYAQPYI